MTLHLSAQQASFYTKNGFLELEELFSLSSCAEHLSLILETLALRRSKMQKDTEYVRGRDLWRDAPGLKSLLLSRKLSGLSLEATRKSRLRLACDQWFEPGYFLQKPQKLSDLFSIQGIICAIFIQFDVGKAELPSKMTPLGLPPFPKAQGNALLFNPIVLLNWPKIEPGMGLYLAAYAVPDSVYVQNANDPACTLMRQYGYGYGDLLRNDTHPLIALK